jgi:hypothetical protein
MFLSKSLCWLLLFIIIPASSASAAFPAEETAWEQIAPGVEYSMFLLADPNNVFVVRMDRSNLNVTLDSSIAQGKLFQGRETVSGMYARYDQALNFWGGNETPPNWGMRNQVVAAINGSYFDWYADMPQGGQVQSGWYAKRYDNLGGWSGFAWKLDRSAFIGKCVYHRPEKQVVTYPAKATTQPITKINLPRGADDLVLYTPQYDSRTGTDSSGVEVVVEMTRPTMILPLNAYASGIVRRIYTEAGDNLIPFNSVVLSARGSAAQSLLENAVIGDEVQISQEITSFDYDCETPYPLSWTKTYASIQGAFFFLENSQIRDFDDPGATGRDPRTAIAYNDQYVFFIVVDGRDVLHSIGMSIHELAVFSRDTLGATFAVAEDGGGSSTMVINGTVVNNTFCNIYTCMGQNVTFLPMVTRSGASAQSVPPRVRDIVSSPAGIERLVTNGMLMLVSQPKAYSTAFVPGEGVATSMEVELRLGPGTNFSAFMTVPNGASVTIMEQINELDGVLAKGDYWWYVSFAGMSGWLPESALSDR